MCGGVIGGGRDEETQGAVCAPCDEEDPLGGGAPSGRPSPEGTQSAKAAEGAAEVRVLYDAEVLSPANAFIAVRKETAVNVS